jgi:proteic killer suppression protein
MEVEFDDEHLEKLASDRETATSIAEPIVTMFRKRIQLIRNSPDERDFYALKSLHFEKLKGPRKHQHSMRLNKKWRLILELRESGACRKVVVIGIEDYH